MFYLSKWHECTFWLFSLISVSVFLILIIAIVRSEGKKEKPTTEIVWAMIPFVLFFIMMIPVANLFIYQ